MEGEAITRTMESGAEGRDGGGGNEEEKKENQTGQKERRVSGEEMEEGNL